MDDLGTAQTGLEIALPPTAILRQGGTVSAHGVGFGEKASAMLQCWSYCLGGVLMEGIPSTSVQGCIHSVPDLAIAQALPCGDMRQIFLPSAHF